MFWHRKFGIENRPGPGARSLVGILLASAAPALAGDTAETLFRDRVKPILEEHCFDCHADGAAKGGVSFDEFQSSEELLRPELWSKVLKNVRAGIMPPPKKSRPTKEEQERLEHWIKHSAFKIDSAHPDPGRVVLRRLNRVEYRNTIRDLMGVEFDTDNQFPADDSGHGFDNIASVLTISPMLMEKYLDAAREIVGRAVPATPGVVAERSVDGRAFAPEPGKGGGAYSLSYYTAAAISNVVEVPVSGRYEVVLNLSTTERFTDDEFDYNRCLVGFAVDGEEVLRREFSREGAKPFAFKFGRHWQAGRHTFALRLEPLTQEPRIRSPQLRLNSLTIRGPFDAAHYTKPRNYDRFFPKPVPADAAGRQAYAQALLRDFAAKAFRRPVDDATVERLASLAETVYRETNHTFEAGISHAMVAVLASPRFLFREEHAEAAPVTEKYPRIDEFSLAGRLSYLLWSSMPDDELFRAAERGALRTNLDAQVKRMLADPRARQFVRNFGGQWLLTRDMDAVQINARAVQAREPSFEPRRAEFDGALRRAMREETELYFDHVVRNDRSVLEFIDSDYTFLNERLAAHYGMEELGVKGAGLRRVTLPANSPRGGILTHGSVLAVTSNPTRTSPVKRGVFVLENILGTPPPPPPPNLPPLEDSGGSTNDRPLTLREALAVHRADAACSSCHNRMDPLGLAFENFNAMGMYRTQELAVPIDASGQLITGESFQNIQGLKKILATRHARSFYETLSEKLLTYALGRGLEPLDTEAVDQIAARLEKTDGKFSALLMGVIESAPFQRTRRSAAEVPQRKTEQANLK